MARRQVIEASEEVQAAEFVEKIASFYDDPYGFVMFAFPWGEAGTSLAEETGPDEWQRTYLQRLGTEIRRRLSAGEDTMGAIQMAVSSGHGVGKSALVAWIIIWFMSTRWALSVVVTANTLGQLSAKTWRELARWHRLAINRDWFLWTATTFYLKDAADTHKANAVPWTKEKSEAFAGTHAANVLMIFDEASAIDHSIYEVSEGAMTTSMAMWLLFGNPTRASGRFRDCWYKFRHRWIKMKVDSRTAKKANRAQIQAWIDDYGEDSDFVRVRVRGEFPRAAATQLIPIDLVEAAHLEYRRRVPAKEIRDVLSAGGEGIAGIKIDRNPIAPWILSCDVARQGGAQTVIGLRCGMTFVVLEKLRGQTIPQTAHRLAHWHRIIRPDQLVVDASGIGIGVCDILDAGGYDVVKAFGSAKAIAERQFYNRRTEIYFAVRDWLAQGGAIDPSDDELQSDLTAIEYGFARSDVVQLETKDDMLKRGLRSPDTADCLAMTFFEPCAPRVRDQGRTKAAWLQHIKRSGRSGQRSGLSFMSN